jgi:Putative bacterial sensory transduction regulator
MTDDRAMAAPDNLSFLTSQIMSGVLQEAGYRVESFIDPTGVSQLRSATNGLPFVVRFGNRLAGEEAGHADASFTTLLQVQGSLPPALLNQWNSLKRFGRLYSGENLLVLEMDFTVLGGVSRDYLRTQVKIWDSVVQELIRYLRTALSSSMDRVVGTGKAEGVAPRLEPAGAPIAVVTAS